MAKFNRQTLGEICDAGGGEIKTGPFGTQLHQSDYVSDGIPVVMPKNIVAGKVALDDIAQIGEDDAQRLKQHRLNRGDIVYGRRGDIGIHALVGQREAGWLCGTGCLRITLGVGPVEPRFLHYYLNQHQVIRWIYNQAIGATMPNLNTSILRSVPIEYPPVPIQRKISGILSAYDDLIENNLRRIKILEEMAQSLYREWFVRFRFPGHEKVRMVDSQIGRIPSGWKVRSLADVTLYIGRGISPKYSDDSATIVINQKCIRDNRLNFAPSRHHQTKVPPDKNVRRGDVLVNSTGVGTLGRVAQVLAALSDCTVDSHVSIVRPLGSQDRDYFGLQVLALQPLFDRSGRGATGQTELSRESMATAPYLDVPTELQSAFGSKVRSVRDLVIALENKNLILKRTRDLLLPKLISGELDVSELDIKIPEEEA
jgi:type I restriction enzyme S subunit